MSRDTGSDWRPDASLAGLQFRARMLAGIRAFFSARDVMEVSTPCLASAAATDPQIGSLAVRDGADELWLQTSPEFHMKRLLAAGSGPIYQIGPAFRQDEQGRWHNREFMMLEWYRPGFDHHALMDELEALWCELAGEGLRFERESYAGLLARYLQFDIDHGRDGDLRARLADALGQDLPDLDRHGLMDAAMGLLIGPALGHERPCFVYDYPAAQAALSRIDDNGRASRFELYWRGIELANGFYELTDPAEQRRRFEQDLQTRQASGLPLVRHDERLLAALEHGLPDCAGVAVGVDRLISLLMGSHSLADVISFTSARA